MVAGLLVIAALMALVLVHELGHFLAARAVGVRATKFSLFFGPAVWKKQIGETEWRIGTIPLGGYVSLPGMFPPTARDAGDRLSERVKQLALGLEDSHDRDALLTALNRIDSAPDIDELSVRLRTLDSELARVSETQAVPAGTLTDLTRDDWQARISRARGIVTAILDDAHPKAYWRAQLWRRMTVIVAGPLVNILVAFLVLGTIFSLYHPVLNYFVGSVEKNSPAAQAGIKSGDEVVSWGGAKATDDAAFAKAISGKRGQTVKVVVRGKDGELKTRTLTPTILAAEEARAKKADAKPRKLVGINFGLEHAGWERKPAAPIDGLQFTGRYLWDLTKSQLNGVARVVVPEGRREISSVVGIVKIAPEVQKKQRLIEYVAMISMALAVLNLLPILPLDGGHLLFGLLEKLRRGRPLPRAAFERYSMLGFAFVLTLFFIGLSNDIGLTT